MAEALSDKELISAYRVGNTEAARVLFDRYYARLIALVHRERGSRLKSIEESTDVAQSVLKSLFGQLVGGPMSMQSCDSLWPLLATIALNKIRNRGKFWQRACRDLARVQSIEQAADPLERGPLPEDAVILRDLVENLLAAFSDRRRRIIELVLEGHPVHTIAAALKISERTVYDTRQAAAEILERLKAGL